VGFDTQWHVIKLDAADIEVVVGELNVVASQQPTPHLTVV
jgi:hypothetical protein